MSSEQQLDPHLIEQTKQQIRSLVNEIAQLARSDASPQEFYGEFLTRVVSALAATGGAVWAMNDDGRLALQYQIQLAEARLDRDEEGQRRHARLLYRAMQTPEGLLVPPQSGSANEEEGGNPTDFLLVLGPLRTQAESVGVVEIFQRSDSGMTAQKGYLRFLLQMCELAADFLKSHQLRHFTDRQALWTQLEDFTRNIHAKIDVRPTAYTIANEARRLIDCDRVSVAIWRRGKCHIEAVSGQDVIEKRSNVIRLLGRLATEVTAAGDPVWYMGDTRDFPPQIEDAVQQYVDESHTKALAVLPLKREKHELVEKTGYEQSKAPDERPFGALIVEQIEDNRFLPTTIQRVNVVCRHSAMALGNAVEHESIFLMPVWRTVGKSRWVVEARNWPKVAIGAVIVLALLAVAFFWPADFELHGKGTLEPRTRRDVFARIDGVVDVLNVEHGDTVTEGQLLGKLRNTELDVSITEVVGQLASTRQEVESIERTLLQDRNKINVEEQSRLRSRMLELRKNLESLGAKHQLLLEKKKDLEIRAPIAGKVLTWDLQNRLIRRPVQRGQVLLRVAKLDDPWEIELRMPEDRMGDITEAQRKIQKDLRITYILANDPGNSHQTVVRQVHESAEVHGEEGSVVLVKGDVQDDIPSRWPGATITGRIYCGRRSLGYVWFHDLWAFLEAKVFFRWF